MGASPARASTLNVEIVGGETFFDAETAEQAIGKPVFPRGKAGAGPVAEVTTDCSSVQSAAVYGTGGAKVRDLVVTSGQPGTFFAEWDWSSNSGWQIPEDIPVGEYKIKVTASCGSSTQTAQGGFFVIFNPEDVRLDFDLPFALENLGDPESGSLVLAPGEQLAVEIPVEAIAPLEAGSVRVEVNTANGKGEMRTVPALVDPLD